ncbi:Heme-binding protein HMX1 [Paramyrothecium foliicola]|nr:Heme-binding protein HMX1 [Paramyrothecium foliicola]
MAMNQVPPQNHDRPLALDITAATRSVHANLNKQIIARLPLALPPHAADPTAYVSGLLHIAPIYIAFEALWRDIIQLAPSEFTGRDGAESAGLPASCSPDMDGKTTHETHSAQVCPRVHAMLNDLYLPDLMRTGRLKEDIRTLTGWSGHVVEEQLETISQTGRLAEFIGHIKRAVQQKPHILLAYSYIMFMALFAGGRFIRASLEAAGDDFWLRKPSAASPSQSLRPARATNPAEASAHHEEHDDAKTSSAEHDSPFCFFHFSTPNDGEDLKLEFKSRLSRAEGVLDARERREIVQEAVCIFDNMRLLVEQLDFVCAGHDQADADNDASMESFGHLFSNPLGARFRDSVAVTKERAARGSSRWSSSSDDVSRSVRSIDADSRPLVPNHPLIPGSSDLKLCPAMAKSMRFEKSSAHALRIQKSSEDLRSNFASSAKTAARGFSGTALANFLIAFAFGAVLVCALLSRRGVVENFQRAHLRASELFGM